MCVCDTDHGDVLDDRSHPNGCHRSPADSHHAVARYHGHEGYLSELSQGFNLYV